MACIIIMIMTFSYNKINDWYIHWATDDRYYSAVAATQIKQLYCRVWQFTLMFDVSDTHTHTIIKPLSAQRKRLRVSQAIPYTYNKIMFAKKKILKSYTTMIRYKLTMLSSCFHCIISLLIKLDTMELSRFVVFYLNV